jgi:hypothetical protein
MPQSPQQGEAANKTLLHCEALPTHPSTHLAVVICVQGREGDGFHNSGAGPCVTLTLTSLTYPPSTVPRVVVVTGVAVHAWVRRQPWGAKTRAWRCIHSPPTVQRARDGAGGCGTQGSTQNGGSSGGRVDYAVAASAGGAAATAAHSVHEHIPIVSGGVPAVPA